MQMSFSDRARAAVLGAHIGDALAFPFHWYYSYDILQKHMDQYYKQDSNGWVHGFQKVHGELQFKHPDSFKYFRLASYWSLSNIVQDHDKCNDNRTAWATKGTHYHHNLRPGETTITVQLCRLLIQSLNESKGYDYEHYLDGYAKYFERPRQHRDTYIEVPHQHFMSVRGKILAKDYPKKDFHKDEAKLRSCAMNESCLSGHTLILPLVLMLAHDPAKAEAAAQAHVGLTHYSKQMSDEVIAMVRLMCGLLQGGDLIDAREKIKAAFYEFQNGVGKSAEDAATAQAKAALPNSDNSLEKLCLIADKDLFVGKNPYALAGEDGCARFSLR